MTPEQLMQPRIKVIADFWNNPFKVGDILLFDFKRQRFFTESKEQYWHTSHTDKQGGTTFYCIESFTKYPHLFRELHFWENRELKELPEYLMYADKTNESMYGIHKVSWEEIHRGYVTFEKGRSPIYQNWWRLATEQEYNTYNQSQK